jgi:phosphoheptose isomerase
LVKKRHIAAVSESAPSNRFEGTLSVRVDVLSCPTMEAKPVMALAASVVMIEKSLRSGGEPRIAGNGGSDAPLMAAEFVGRFWQERTPWGLLH